jgi:hypothetical protein
LANGCRAAALPSRTAEEDVTAIAARFGLDHAPQSRVVEEVTAKDR